MRVKIRPAGPQDATNAVQLIYAAADDISRVLTGATAKPDVLAALTQFFQAPGNRLSYQQALVAESASGEVVGIIVLYHGRDADALDAPIAERLRHLKNDPTITIDKEAQPDEFYIDTLSVDPRFAGQGIGTALLHAAEEHAARLPHTRLALNVDLDNARALRLYQHLDYQTTQEIQIIGHPYFHMVKNLS